MLKFGTWKFSKRRDVANQLAWLMMERKLINHQIKHIRLWLAEYDKLPLAADLKEKK